MKPIAIFAIVCVALLVAAPARTQPSQPATSQAASAPADVIADALETKTSPAMERRYPKLVEACGVFARDWAERDAREAASDANRTPLKIAFRTVLSPIDQRELCRYLNFWYRSRTVQRWENGRYPAGTFDKVPAEPPLKQAYVIFSDGPQHFLVRFNWEASAEEGVKEEFWADSDFTSFLGAARMGAALTIVQDALESLAAGKEIASFTAGATWPGGKPIAWSFVEKSADGEGQGFAPLEKELAAPVKAATIAVRVRCEGKKDADIAFHLAQQPKPDRYTGWRIDKIEATK